MWACSLCHAAVSGTDIADHQEWHQRWGKEFGAMEF